MAKYLVVKKNGGVFINVKDPRNKDAEITVKRVYGETVELDKKAATRLLDAGFIRQEITGE